jgi:hypothetical protein
MKTVELAEATNPLADYVPGVRTEPLVITENGTPTALMLPLYDGDLESLSLGTNPAFLALIGRSRSRAEGEVSADEMRRRVLDGSGGERDGDRPGGTSALQARCAATSLRGPDGAVDPVDGGPASAGSRAAVPIEGVYALTAPAIATGREAGSPSRPPGPEGG